MIHKHESRTIKTNQNMFGISNLFHPNNLYSSGIVPTKRRFLGYKMNDNKCPELLAQSSVHSGPFALPLERWSKRLEKEMAQRRECNKLVTTEEMWWNLILKGHTYVRQTKTRDAMGMDSIRDMMNLCLLLAKHNNMLLEPFQVETVRACISSSSRRILGHHIDKYKGEILTLMGLVDESFTDMEGNVAKEEMYHLFDSYAKRFVAVIAPRRNGKSKAGKLFVAVNAVCEEGARIVLIAHCLNAVLLYKQELLLLLEQIRDVAGEKFVYKVHGSATEICIEFPSPRPNAHIYFVAGGINVSCSMFLWPYLNAFHYHCFTVIFIPCNF